MSSAPPANSRPLFYVRNKWLAAFMVTKGFVEAEQPAIVEDRTTGKTTEHYCFHHAPGGLHAVIIRAWEAVAESVRMADGAIFDSHVARLTPDHQELARQVGDYYVALVNANRIERNTRRMIKVAHPRRQGVTAVLPANYGPQRAAEFGLPHPSTKNLQTK